MAFVLAGVICVALSGALLYKMLPRDGVPAPTESAETAMALGQFSLLIFGIAMIIKGTV